MLILKCMYVFYIAIVFLDGTSINRIARVPASSVSPRSTSSIILNSYQSSRRNSVDSLDESSPNFRDLKV